MFLLSIIIVITQPYKNIDYNKINSYEIESNYSSIDINVHCAEGHDDCNEYLSLPDPTEPIKYPAKYTEPEIYYIFR